MFVLLDMLLCSVLLHLPYYAGVKVSLSRSVDFGVLVMWRDRKRTSWIRELELVEDIFATVN